MIFEDKKGRVRKKKTEYIKVEVKELGEWL